MNQIVIYLMNETPADYETLTQVSMQIDDQSRPANRG